jgi:hypothetical protein
VSGSRRHAHARRAPRPQPGPRPAFRDGPYAVAVGVLVALLAGAGLAQGVESVQHRGESTAAGAELRMTLPVRTATLACPAPVVRGGGASSDISLAAPPREGAGKDGEATLRGIAGGPPRIKLTQPGGGSLDVSAANTPPQVATGSKSLAPGLTAEMVTTASGGLGKGLSAVSCMPPSNDFWFVGGSTAPGRLGRLVLSNVDQTQALLDLRLWSDKGPVVAPGTRALTVDPGEQRTVRIDGLSPGHGRLAVSVRVRTGRVAAAMHDQDALGVTIRGSDWIAPADEPVTRLVLPGVPGGAGARRLQILAPGRTDAIVKVTVAAMDRSFAPAGLDTIQLRAGRVTEVNLDKVAQNQPLSVVLDSDEPIVAAVRMSVGRDPADVGYTTATGPLTGTAVVAGARGGRRGTTTLLLTAPETAAKVTLTALVPRGTSPKPRTITVPAGRTVAVVHAPRGAEAYALVVSPEPGSGPVYAAHALTAQHSSEPLLTSSPLVAGRYDVPVPRVQSDPSAVLP